MEELDIVNEQDEVIGKATRKDIYAKKLRHRTVHVMVLDGEKIVLQKRAPHLSFCPNHWTTSAVGHVFTGETYEEGALREYAEELGVASELTFLATDDYENDGLKKFITTFTTKHPGPFTYDPEEVSGADFFTPEEIQQLIVDGELFHRELVCVLKKYFLP